MTTLNDSATLEIDTTLMDAPIQSGSVLSEPGAVMFDPSNADEPIVISPTNSDTIDPTNHNDQENKGPRNVRFQDLPKKKAKPLQEQLEQAKMDYNAERSLRKRKEKGLLKLAKELKKRSKESATLHNTMAKMASTIVGLEETVETQRIEMDECQSQYRALTRQADDRMGSFEAATTNLRKQLLEIKLENDRLKVQLAGKNNTSGGIGNIFVVVWMTTLIGSVWRFCMDVAKSPIRPGTTLRLNAKEGIYQTLWWVPAFLATYDMFCSSTKLTWNKGRLTISTRDDGVVYDSVALAVEIEARTITIVKDSVASTEVIAAPWVIKQS